MPAGRPALAVWRRNGRPGVYKPDRYPQNWTVLARAVKEAAGWQCQSCHVSQGAERVSKRTGAVYRVALAAAHLDHDPDNPAPRLAALCPSCHGRYDWQWRARRGDWRLVKLKSKIRLKARLY